MITLTFDPTNQQATALAARILAGLLSDFEDTPEDKPKDPEWGIRVEPDFPRHGPEIPVTDI